MTGKCETCVAPVTHITVQPAIEHLAAEDRIPMKERDQRWWVWLWCWIIRRPVPYRDMEYQIVGVGSSGTCLTIDRPKDGSGYDFYSVRDDNE